MTQESTRTVGKSEQSVTPKACCVMLVQCRNGNQNQNSRQMLVAVRGVATTTVSPFGSMWTHVHEHHEHIEYPSYHLDANIVASMKLDMSCMHTMHTNDLYLMRSWLATHPNPTATTVNMTQPMNWGPNDFSMTSRWVSQGNRWREEPCMFEYLSFLCKVFCGVKPCEDWPGKRKKEKTFPAARTWSAPHLSGGALLGHCTLTSW